VHKIGADLKFTQENDIRFMKKIRCYKGIRHSMGQPVRGQRTKSNFRKNKGKVTGVAKTKQAKAAAAASSEKKEKKEKPVPKPDDVMEETVETSTPVKKEKKLKKKNFKI
jgi:hypothetical protein